MINQLISHWLLLVMNEYLMTKQMQFCGIFITHGCHELLIDAIDCSLLVTHYIFTCPWIKHYLKNPNIPQGKEFSKLNNVGTWAVIVWLNDKWQGEGSATLASFANANNDVVLLELIKLKIIHVTINLCQFFLKFDHNTRWNNVTDIYCSHAMILMSNQCNKWLIKLLKILGPINIS